MNQIFCDLPRHLALPLNSFPVALLNPGIPGKVQFFFRNQLEILHLFYFLAMDGSAYCGEGLLPILAVNSNLFKSCIFFISYLLPLPSQVHPQNSAGHHYPHLWLCLPPGLKRKHCKFELLNSLCHSQVALWLNDKGELLLIGCWSEFIQY